MIRIVSVRKALAAGTAGALAWEALARPLLLAGLPLPDIVLTLGTLVLPAGPAPAAPAAPAPVAPPKVAPPSPPANTE